MLGVVPDRRPLDAAGSTIRDCDLDPVGQRESLDLVRGCGPDTLIFVHGCTSFDWFFDPPSLLAARENDGPPIKFNRGQITKGPA